MAKIHGFEMFWDLPDLDWIAQEIGSGFQINFSILWILSEIIFRSPDFLKQNLGLKKKTPCQKTRGFTEKTLLVKSLSTFFSLPN